jgi:hypothetical protein
MDLLLDMETYFKGERDLAIIILPFSLAMFALSYYLWLHYKGAFAQAFMVTSLVLGLGLFIAGTVMMIKGNVDLGKNTASIQTDAQAFVTAETERVQGMNKVLWPALKIAWSVLIVLSLLVIFLINSPVLKGIALALLLGASIFLVVDILAEKRALIYEQKLKG